MVVTTKKNNELTGTKMQKHLKGSWCNPIQIQMIDVNAQLTDLEEFAGQVAPRPHQGMLGGKGLRASVISIIASISTISTVIRLRPSKVQTPIPFPCQSGIFHHTWLTRRLAFRLISHLFSPCERRHFFLVLHPFTPDPLQTSSRYSLAQNGSSALCRCKSRLMSTARALADNHPGKSTGS